jgi:Protein of unknown function (DUF2889)
MPLTDPVPRRPVHRREVHTQAFRRDDGLWDIEAHLRDTKRFATQDFERGQVPAGGAIHDMRVRVTIDAALVVQAVEASTDAAPFSGCVGPSDEFGALVGAPLSRGWRRHVHEHFGGAASCTHLVALFEPVATTAYQALCGGPDPRGEDPLAWEGHQLRRPFFIGGCRSWREDGPTVAMVYQHAAWQRKEFS